VLAHPGLTLLAKYLLSYHIYTHKFRYTHIKICIFQVSHTYNRKHGRACLKIQNCASLPTATPRHHGVQAQFLLIANFVRMHCAHLQPQPLRLDMPGWTACVMFFFFGVLPCLIFNRVGITVLVPRVPSVGFCRGLHHHQLITDLTKLLEFGCRVDGFLYPIS